MRLLKTALLLVAALSLVSATTFSFDLGENYDHNVLMAHPEEAFRLFVSEFGKTYSSAKEAQQRFETFRRNLALISHLNTYGGAEFRVNQFADMSPEEFQGTILVGPLTSTPMDMLAQKRAPNISTSDVPSSLDWRNKNVVTPVKDQGSVGTCWAFSAVGNIEGQMAMSGRPLTSLSVEQLTDCDSGDCGVFGGFPWLAYEYIIKAGGIESEADYPYCAGNGQCYPCMANTNQTFCGPPPYYCKQTCMANPALFSAAITDWWSVVPDADQVAARLARNGPLSVCLNAGTLQFYHKGIFNPANWLCSPSDIDHCVLLTGFGVEDSATGPVAFWQIKNSWGTKWGEQGYFRILRGTNKCGIESCATSSVFKGGKSV